MCRFKGKSIYVAASVLAVLVVAASLVGCDSRTKVESDGWQWPKQMVIASSGGSGLAKYLSWTTMLEQDTGVTVRIVPEEASVQRFINVQRGEMLLVKGGKSEIANMIEAIEGHAVREGGPFQVRMVWMHAISNSGIFVRGDSAIKTLADIKPGIRWAVWSMQPTVLKVPRAILDWVQVKHDDVIWVNTGTFDGAARAVAEGRADIMFGFPTSAAIYEAAAAPEGIRFISLNSDLDPAGAARFRMIDPMYAFAPIRSGVPEARGVWGTEGNTIEVTRAETDPQLVYHLAKWLDENYKRYKDAFSTNETMSIENVMAALNTTYLPAHDGLVKYLREKGLWTPQHDKRQATNQAQLDRFVKAYPEAIKLADAKGIKIDPANKEWNDFWVKFKKDQGIRDLSLHQSLTVD